jgi:hypothetical protein
MHKLPLQHRIIIDNPVMQSKGTFAQIRILMMQDDILSFFQMYNA